MGFLKKLIGVPKKFNKSHVLQIIQLRNKDNTVADNVRFPLINNYLGRLVFYIFCDFLLITVKNRKYDIIKEATD